MLVECDAGVDDAWLAEPARELSPAHEGLRCGVMLAEPGALPRFVLKARRLVDERELWGLDRPTAGKEVR